MAIAKGLITADSVTAEPGVAAPGSTAVMYRAVPPAVIWMRWSVYTGDIGFERCPQLPGDTAL
jgi:hypothetical protein